MEKQHQSQHRLNLLGRSRRPSPAPADITSYQVGGFLGELAILIRAHGKLNIQVLESAAASTDNLAVKRLIMDVRDQVSTGVTFSSACRSHPDEFSFFLCNALAEAERSGRESFCATLEQLSLYLRG